MTITDAVFEFSHLLSLCMPFLERSGVTVGDDEWDEFTEVTFHAIVGTPIFRATGNDLGWTYGVWHDKVQGKARIYVVAYGLRSVLIGRGRENDGIQVVEYREEGSAVAEVRFAFRELGHPLAEPGTELWASYVLGEVVGENQPWPSGVRICLPVKDCKFVFVE